MNLIIAEKNALAKQIADALGGAEKINKYTYKNGDWYITYLGGHSLEFDLPKENQKWTLSSLPLDFKGFKKKEKEDKRELLQNVKSLLSKASKVINAGDMDDEGQLLVDEVLDYYHNTKPVYRLNTADTTKETLRKNLENLEDNKKYLTQGLSAEARSRADAIFGFNYTRYYTLTSGNGKVISIGRVQTPTLRLVVDRDNEIENFIPKNYKELYFLANDRVYAKVVLAEDDELLDKDGYLTEEKNIQKLISLIENKTFKGEVKQKEKTQSPPKPFNLATLSVWLEKKYGYSPSQVMSITQSLRDKYNAISYNRSECEYLPISYYENKDKLIKRTLENLHSPATEKNFKEEDGYKSKCFDQSKIELHFAIVPQDVRVDTSSMTKEEKNTYTEIAKRFLLQFMGDRKIAETSLEIDLGDKRKGVAVGQKEIKKGWAMLEDAPSLNGIEIPFAEGKGDFLMTAPKTKDLKTSPPKRFSPASLVKAMTQISKYCKDEQVKALLLKKDEGKTGDRGSIGTSATRDKIIDTLLTRGYVEKKGKELYSTKYGKDFIEKLPQDLSSVETTARWFEIQEGIKSGKKNIEDLTRSVEEKFMKTLEGKGSLDLNFKNSIRESPKSYTLLKNGNLYCIGKNFLSKFKLKLSQKELEEMFKNESGTLTKQKLTSPKSGKKFDCDVSYSFAPFKDNMYSCSFNLEFEKGVER